MFDIPNLRHPVNNRASRLEQHNKIALEFGLVELIRCPLEDADNNIINFVLLKDDLGGFPIGSLVESFDVGFAGAVGVPTSAPLEFVPRPANDGGDAAMRGDACIAGVTSTHRFGHNSQRSGLQVADDSGIFRVGAVEVGGTVESQVEGRIEVVGFVGESEDRIGQSGHEDEEESDAPQNIPKAAQILEEDYGPECGGDGPQLPALIVELEDGVDTITEVVAQVDKVRGEDEEGGEEGEEEDEVGGGWLVVGC